MANPSQLFLLADHIKLSLLERQRAISLDLEPNAQDGNISRSLESMREGIETLEQEASRLENNDDPSASSLSDQASRLRAQYSTLSAQFSGIPTHAAVSSSPLSQPNNASLAPDFAAAMKPPTHPHSSLKRNPPSPSPNKSVRFRDASDEDTSRSELLPYRDEPASPPDQSEMSNQQVHAYHAQVMAQQDEQLDALGASIGRQRDLSIQIGDELDEHVAMLDDVDRHVDRTQGRMDGARARIGRIARKANDNKSVTVIAVLIVILILLILALKT